MKRLSIILLLSFFCTHIYAQVTNKDTHKAVFQVFTYNQEGKLLNSGIGFFVDDKGSGVASYELLRNSYTAEIIDYKGEKYTLHRILGANSNYDMVKISIQPSTRTAWFKLPTDTLNTPSSLFLVDYSGKKKSKLIPYTIDKVEKFEEYKYFHLTTEKNHQQIGCPLINSAGDVVAITQKNYDRQSPSMCAIDARFIQRLKITEKSAFETDLRTLNYPVALPSDASNAMTYLYMIGFRDSAKVHVAIEDFIQSYPNDSEIYMHQGNFYAHYDDYSNAETAYSKAFEKSQNTDEVHYKLSKLIFSEVLQHGDTLTENWHLDRACSEATKAYQANPQPHYALQQAHCLFYMQRYAEAHLKYIQACRTAPNDWSYTTKVENWFNAVRSLELSGAQIAETVSLMDSLIAILPRPIQPIDAHYLLERGHRLQKIQEFRKAVLDYNEYELIIGHQRLNDVFYYMRSQAELNAHMYQQALDDIRTAITKNSDNELYHLEEAAILLQVGMHKEAIQVCENSLQRLPENPDCYKIMGIAYGEMGQRKKSIAALQKAVSLGDTSASKFIKKYQK